MCVCFLQKEAGVALSPVTLRSREEMSSTVQIMRRSRRTERAGLLALIQQLLQTHRLIVGQVLFITQTIVSLVCLSVQLAF